MGEAMRIVRLLLMGAMGMALVTASAQAGSPVTPAELAGEWSGSLAGTLPLVLHLQADASER